MVRTGRRIRTIVCGRAMTLDWHTDEGGTEYAVVGTKRALYMVWAAGALRRPRKRNPVTLCEGWELHAEGGGRFRLYQRVIHDRHVANAGSDPAREDEASDDRPRDDSSDDA